MVACVVASLVSCLLYFFNHNQTGISLHFPVLTDFRCTNICRASNKQLIPSSRRLHRYQDLELTVPSGGDNELCQLHKITFVSSCVSVVPSPPHKEANGVSETCWRLMKTTCSPQSCDGVCIICVTVPICRFLMSCPWILSMQQESIEVFWKGDRAVRRADRPCVCDGSGNPVTDI